MCHSVDSGHQISPGKVFLEKDSAGISDPFLNEDYYTNGFSDLVWDVTVTSQTICVVTFIEKRIGDPRSNIFQKYSPRLDYFDTSHQIHLMPDLPADKRGGGARFAPPSLSLQKHFTLGPFPSLASCLGEFQRRRRGFGSTVQPQRVSIHAFYADLASGRVAVNW